MHQNRYLAIKSSSTILIKLYYALTALRSDRFYLVRHQQKLQKLHWCNRYPPSSSKRLTFPRISFIFVPFHALVPSLALSFSSHLSVSLALVWSFRTVCQAERRYTPSIVLILSYVAAAIVSSLRSSAIPLTAAYVSNVCRGMSGDSPRKVG